MELELKEKVALVTGSSRNIGAEIALVFAQEGAKVAVTYYHNEQKAREVANRIESNGGEALVLRLNVAEEKSVEKVINTIKKEWGRLDILVNNAITSGWTSFSFGEEKLGRWKEMIDSGLTGAYLCCFFSYPLMKEQGWGRIVNISSGIGIEGRANASHYTSVKAGLIGLTKALAKDLGPYGILANAVAPGLVETDREKDPKAEERLAKYSQLNPLKRPASPNDVARTVLFLASGWNRYVNGAVIPVNGGG